MTVIPISELKNTSAVTSMCRESPDPLLVTKNGYEELVILTPSAWREASEAIKQNRLYREIAQGEAAMKADDVVDYWEDTARLRESYGL